MEQVQGYYGEYNLTQKAVVDSWISNKTERALNILYAEILKAVSPMYKVPPGVKELEDAWKIVITDRWMELEAPQEQNKNLIEERYLPREEAGKIIKECLTKITEKSRYNARKKDTDW